MMSLDGGFTAEQLAVQAQPLKRSTVNVAGFGRDASVEPREKKIAPDQAVITKPAGINTKLVAELLEKLFLFIPRQLKILGEEVDCKNSNDNDLVRWIINKHFLLRYVCRKWRDVVDSNLHLTLDCSLHTGRYKFLTEFEHTSILSEVRLLSPNRRVFASHFNDDHPSYYLEDLSKLSKSTFVGQVERINLILTTTNEDDDEPQSIAAFLSQIAKVIQRPCNVSLHLITETHDSAAAFVKDPHVDFCTIFPDLTVDRLDFAFPVAQASFNEQALRGAKKSLKYLLGFSAQSLTVLKINLFVLGAALNSLPGNWTCESLESLETQLKPLSDGFEYSVADLQAIFRIQALLPCRFPNIKLILFAASRPVIDFVVLNHMKKLRSVCLLFCDGAVDTDRMRQECNIASLEHVNAVDLIFCPENPPLQLGSFAPNAEKLHINPLSRTVAADLSSAAQRKNGFAQLNSLELALKFSGGSVATYEELVQLLIHLRRHNALTNFSLRAADINNDVSFTWSPAGDLSLLEILPQSVQTVSIDKCLSPCDPIKIDGVWRAATTVITPTSEESVYKKWMRNLLHQAVELHALKRLNFTAWAPGFQSVASIAKKWQQSPKLAVAELGMLSVMDVSCTPIYPRMLGTQPYQFGDGFEFRFLLALAEPTSQPGPSSTPPFERSGSNKRLVTISVVLKCFDD